MGVSTLVIFLYTYIIFASCSEVNHLRLEFSERLHQTSGAIDPTAIYPAYYDVIGPFPKGFREVGADPLEAFGGIRKIPRANNATYPSDLYFGAAAGWQQFNTNNESVVSIQYPNASLANWNLMLNWGGMAALGFQGWALGDITIPSDGYYLSMCNVGSYYLDQLLVAGDSYSQGRQFYPVQLSSGKHTFYVPFSDFQSTQFSCYVIRSSGSSLRYIDGDHTFPDLMSYNNLVQIVSPYASVAVTNVDPALRSTLVYVQSNDPMFGFSQPTPTYLAPGQTSPINFQIYSISNMTACPAPTYTFSVKIFCKPQNSEMNVNVTVNCMAWPVIGHPYGYIYTFPDFDNSVQYSVAVPPARPCLPQQAGGCSILFSFHGAGVTSTGPGWAGWYQKQNSSWLLLPTNRRPYGFDWQGPGRLNGWESFFHFTNNLPGVPSSLAQTYKADPNRVIFTGHSMGGHGCWLYSTHFPDRAIAVAPASGWIKMQFYIAYFTRLGLSLVNPFVELILESSISENNADFYTPQVVGIPYLTRFGSDDDNVPPYHMRRMTRLIDQLNHDPNFVEVSEVPGEGHWFTNVVDGPPMQEFFDKHSTQNIPPLPTSFTVVTMNPASSEGRGAIRIAQLTHVGRAAYIHVRREGQLWHLKTENVRRFSFENLTTIKTPNTVRFANGQTLGVVFLPSHYFNNNGNWQVVNNNAWEGQERHPKTYGPLFQVFQGPVMIVYGTLGNAEQSTTRFEYARYLTNTMWYKGRYAIPIYADKAVPSDYNNYNLILIGGPSTNQIARANQNLFPVSFNGSYPVINNQEFNSSETGIAFLAPGVNHSRLIAVLDGTDEKGLAKALAMLPISSAMTMPDYAVAGPDWGWAGSAGLVATGFWNNMWKYDSTMGYISTHN